MINFANLFGNFNRGNWAINEVLESPDATIESLLDAETFPNEYKSNNQKVLEFLKYDKYKDLIRYVTVEGPTDDQKKGYKFPMIAADVLSSENSTLSEMILPDDELQVNVDYDSTEEYEQEEEDEEKNDKNQGQKQKEQSESNEQTKQPQSQTEEKEASKPSEEATEESSEKKKEEKEGESQEKLEAEQVSNKKVKMVTKTRVVKKTRKEPKEPLIHELFQYFEGPINYTLAGYVCKVLTSIFKKKSSKFYAYLFEQGKDRVELLCGHIESRSVGDFVFKLLVNETAESVSERKAFYDHLIQKLSEVSEAHVISNLAYTLNQIIEKSATYIKAKPSVSNSNQVTNAFLQIFYRTEVIHSIVSQTLAKSDSKSGYSCLVLHSYLHHTEIETFNSFNLEKVLEDFIEKSLERLRQTPTDKKKFGMGRVKIVEIFFFLVRKPKKVIGEEESNQNKASAEPLEEMYIHELIAKYTDFFGILFRLVQSFEKNNILHNQVFKIVESVILEPEQNKSALQSLLLDEECALLKFIIEEEAKDSEVRKNGKTSKSKGYIGHIINICKLISKTENNTLLDARIRQDSDFNRVLNTMVAAGITETNKNLAGYQMKKNPVHQVMFQKEDIIAAYTDFLGKCPKPEFEIERETSEEESTNMHEETSAQQMAIQEQRDEEKFNEVSAVAEEVSESDPKFWMNHITYDLDVLLNDVL